MLQFIITSEYLTPWKYQISQYPVHTIIIAFRAGIINRMNICTPHIPHSHPPGHPLPHLPYQALHNYTENKTKNIQKYFPRVQRSLREFAWLYVFLGNVFFWEHWPPFFVAANNELSAQIIHSFTHACIPYTFQVDYAIPVHMNQGASEDSNLWSWHTPGAQRTGRTGAWWIGTIYLQNDLLDSILIQNLTTFASSSWLPR